MELKDYLHLYLGCECMIEYFSGPSDNPKKLTSLVLHEFENNGNKFGYNIKEVKPLLRRLDSIKSEDGNDEKEQLFDFIWPDGKYGVVWAGKVDFITWLLDISDDYPADFKLCEELMYSMKFTDFVRVANWLRSKGFDCDGLIDAGLAIDINQK